MKKLYAFAVFALATFCANAQDEGTITKRERIARDKNIFLSIGPSFTLGKNIGDYSAGFNFELGFVKRVNRVLSVGPSISYLKFEYDPEKTGYNNIFIGGPYNQGGGDYWLGALIDFEGGDVSLTSLAVNLKLNLIPVKDATKISVYGFAKPFVSLVSRSKVSGTAVILSNVVDPYDADYWVEELTIPWEDNDEFDLDISDKLESGSEVTGGIFIGPGVELNPAKNLSFFVQASFGYTFPITYVSTEAYKDESFDTLEGDFPMIKKGFPSVNVQFGMSFNF